MAHETPAFLTTNQLLLAHTVAFDRLLQFVPCFEIIKSSSRISFIHLFGLRIISPTNCGPRGVHERRHCHRIRSLGHPAHKYILCVIIPSSSFRPPTFFFSTSLRPSSIFLLSFTHSAMSDQESEDEVEDHLKVSYSPELQDVSCTAAFASLSYDSSSQSHSLFFSSNAD